MVILDLNDRLYDHSSALQHVEHFRLRANVEYDVVRLVLNLVELLVQFQQVDERPILEERKTLQKLLSFVPLQELDMLRKFTKVEVLT